MLVVFKGFHLCRSMTLGLRSGSGKTRKPEFGFGSGRVRVQFYTRPENPNYYLNLIYYMKITQGPPDHMIWTMHFLGIKVLKEALELY
jgi:hypothetical protein